MLSYDILYKFIVGGYSEEFEPNLSIVSHLEIEGDTVHSALHIYSIDNVSPSRSTLKWRNCMEFEHTSNGINFLV